MRLSFRAALAFLAFPALLAFAAASAGAVVGCELLAGVDRDAIRHDGGGGASGSGATGASSAATGGAGGAGGLQCIHPFDCAGADTDCVKRTCTGGRCGEGPVAAGAPTSTQVSGDCMRQVCDGKGGMKLVVDDLDVPVSAAPCFDPLCVGGSPSSAPSAAAAPCDQGGGKVCDGLGHCVGCVANAQCPGAACVNNACVAVGCTDKIKDGTETDVDCGGTACPPCGAGKGCALAADCVSAVCSGVPGVCQPPSCTDKVKNGLETDVDCGGACPLGCGAGKACLAHHDCLGGECAASMCLPTCADGVKNGAETAVDCGGGGCSPCAAGLGCAVATDCASGVCTAGHCVAPAASCGGTKLNGTETDVGCGGPSCPPCAAGKLCVAAGDCASGRCVGGACAPRILISQVRSRGPGGAHDEFVELYNPGATPVTLDAGWTLTTRSAVGQCDANNVRALFTGAGQVIAPHGHLLLGGAAYTPEPPPDAALALGGVADAASVVLSQGGAVVDALCYAFDAATTASLTGCSVPYLCAGAPASNLPHDDTQSAASVADASLDRRPGGALGNGANTGVSRADFRAVAPATPESSTSPPAP